MSPHAGIVLALMVLLVAAGVGKVYRPIPTAGALRLAGLPSSMILVRLLGAVEIGVGVGGIVTGGPIAALSGAVLYGSFALFVIYALRRRLPLASCGCLGATETPPSVTHVVVNLGAVVALVVGAMFPIGPWGSIGEEADLVVPFVFLTGATVFLLYGLIAVLPLVGRRPITTLLELSPTRGAANS